MNDDMFCEECKEPFVDPSSYCKHQCDDQTYLCAYGGECIADDDGVMIFKFFFIKYNLIFEGQDVPMPG